MRKTVFCTSLIMNVILISLCEDENILRDKNELDFKYIEQIKHKHSFSYRLWSFIRRFSHDPICSEMSDANRGWMCYKTLQKLHLGDYITVTETADFRCINVNFKLANDIDMTETVLPCPVEKDGEHADYYISFDNYSKNDGFSVFVYKKSTNEDLGLYRYITGIHSIYLFVYVL